MGVTDVERVRGWIASARHVAVLSGAGVSAESGIPTFRGNGGLWKGRDPMSLATPEAFEENPELVWEFYHWRRGIVAAAQPNPGHVALAKLETLIPKLTLISQNVDRLHQRAGSKNVLEIHGNLSEIRCVACDWKTDPGLDPLPALPRCEACGKLARPCVVWFGEALPPTVFHDAGKAATEAEVFLVVGTSAAVYPAAGLATLASRVGNRVVEINVEPTHLSDLVDVGLYGPSGEILPTLLPSWN